MKRNELLADKKGEKRNELLADKKGQKSVHGVFKTQQASCRVGLRASWAGLEAGRL